MHFYLIIYVKLTVLFFCYVFNYAVCFMLKNHEYCMNTVQGRLLKPKQPVWQGNVETSDNSSSTWIYQD